MEQKKFQNLLQQKCIFKCDYSKRTEYKIDTAKCKWYCLRIFLYPAHVYCQSYGLSYEHLKFHDSQIIL